MYKLYSWLAFHIGTYATYATHAKYATYPNISEGPLLVWVLSHTIWSLQEARLKSKPTHLHVVVLKYIYGLLKQSVLKINNTIIRNAVILNNIFFLGLIIWVHVHSPELFDRIEALLRFWLLCTETPPFEWVSFHLYIFFELSGVSRRAEERRVGVQFKKYIWPQLKEVAYF